ncbi:unnamed protein product, partial [Brenthis ino]
MFWTKKSLNQNDGVVAYVRKELSISSCEPEFTEGNCLTVTISTKYTLVCSYRPPSFRKTNAYLNSLEQVIRNIKTQNIILTGDINIDTLNDNSSGPTQDYLNLLAMYGLRQGINLPTRNNTCLDHFMVKCSNAWKTVVFEQQITDHSPILLYISNARVNKNDMTYQKLKIDHEAIKNSLNNECWKNLYRTADINIACEILIDKLLLLIEDNTSSRTVSKRNRPLKPWITYGVVKCIKKRDRLHRRVKKFPNDTDLKQKYTTYRNSCNHLIKSLKAKYYEERLINDAGNIKKQWQTIKEVCNISQNKVSSEELLNINDSPSESVATVNSYFTSIGGTLAKGILNRLNTKENELARLARTSSGPLNSMSFVPTDPHEVRNIVLGL